MDAEVKVTREELKSLRQLEVELELKVESGHKQLLQYVKLVHATQVQVCEVSMVYRIVCFILKVFFEDTEVDIYE